MVKIQDIPELVENLNVLLHKKPEDLIIQKAAEELSELVTEILKKLNKPEKVNDDEIREEIADVKMNLHLLGLLFNGKVEFKMAELSLQIASEYYKNLKQNYSHEETIKICLSNIAKLLKYLVEVIHEKHTYFSYKKALIKVYRAELSLFVYEKIFHFNIGVMKEKAEKFATSKDLKKYKNV